PPVGPVRLAPAGGSRGRVVRGGAAARNLLDAVRGAQATGSGVERRIRGLGEGGGEPVRPGRDRTLVLWLLGPGGGVVLQVKINLVFVAEHAPGGGDYPGRRLEGGRRRRAASVPGECFAVKQQVHSHDSLRAAAGRRPKGGRFQTSTGQE